MAMLTIRAFAIALGFMYMTEILSAAFQKSAITTIERRFELTSTAIALVATSYQFGSLAVLLFVSYYGAKWNRPRLLAIGSVLIFIGHMVAALPQFIGGRHAYVDIQQYNSTATGSALNVDMCERRINYTNDEADECATDGNVHSENNLYILIVIGVMLCGVGGSGTSSLGLAYVDDYAHPLNRPVYMGIVFTMALVGPAFGFIMGSIVLRIWVDIGWVDTETITITPMDPGWVGAWWLGFLFGGFVVGISGIIFWFFPRSMELEKLKNDDEKKSSLKNEKLSKLENNNNVKTQDGFCLSAKRILTNRAYVLLQLYWFFSANAMLGIITFVPKHLETQFGVSASKANMLYGAISIPALVVGTMFGSYLLKKLKLNNYTTSLLVTFIGIGIFATKVPLAFLGCDTIDIAGVSVPYYGHEELSPGNVTSECNFNCGCQDGVYSPICGEDFITYVSPCHAGCESFEVDDNSRIQNYTQCSCLPPKYDEGTAHGTAHPGRCVASNCPHLLKFAMFCLSLSSFLGGILTTPVYMLLMRSVESRDKSLAIGISYLLLRVFAWIPGPIYYGAMIDSTCLYWGSKLCSSAAYCKVYDQTAFRYKFVFTLSVWKILSILVSVALSRHFKSKQVEEVEANSVEEMKLNASIKKKTYSSEENSLIEEKTTVV